MVAGEAMDPAMLEDFGQKVDLTRRIREVLVNYPEGTTVLKELVQNADDAGATKVCFCLDRRSHGVASLLSERLAQWQGPALLAYNDAVFTEVDFVSICSIGDSKKQGQSWKTGRFGVGFNSVYHLTDLPSFVSDKYVVLFDPHREYLPNVSSLNPGKRLDFVSSSAISFYKDQFFPYCAFGCDMKRPFLGTLFRFPLRNAYQAAVSKLSRQSYLEDDIFSMFSQFYKETIFTMLFLKNIISIEMYVWDAGINEPQKIYSCSISATNENMALHRQAVLRLSKSIETEKRVFDSFSLDFLSESFYGAHREKRVDTFFLVQAMASSSSKIGAFAAAAADEFGLQLLPWASIAACISSDSSEDDVLTHGQAFCFLPLPVRTGLKVQVNGYFEVSSNRRSIWHGGDMDRGGKLRSEWNRLLLEHVVAPAFSELLIGLSEVLGPTALYYSLWPCGSFEEPWNLLVDHVYENIVGSPVIYSDVGGGKWVSPLEAFFHDIEFYRSSDLGEALISLGMPIVYLPKLVIEMMFHHVPNFWQRAVNPVSVRHFLKKCELLVSVSRYHKLVLLEYCLSDLNDADVGKYALGLPLVPLENGGFASFSEASNAPSFFICTELECKLLEQVSDQIIDHSIPPELFSRFSAVATTSTTNIMVFDAQCLLQILPRILPAEWKYRTGIHWDVNSGLSHPTASWFMLFWQYLHNHCHDLSIFNDWPILPSTTGHLYRASRLSRLIDAKPLSDSLQNILVKIGCKILDPSYGVEHKELNLYVYEPNGAGILNAISEVVHVDDAMFQLPFRDFSATEKNELCQFFLDGRWYYGGIMDESQISTCKKLPIFRVYAAGPSSTMLFSDLENPKKYLPPYNVPDHLLGGDFLCCSSHTEEEILQRYFGIRRIEKAMFYKEYVLNRITELPSEIRNKVMLNILQDLPQLCSDDPSFKESLRDLEFVPTFSGSLKSPQSLYDPRVDDLYALLEDCDCFPQGLFQEPDVLGMLQNLGLRTSVSADTIIQSAHQIESLVHIDHLKAYSRGKVLLSYLEVNAIKWVCKLPIDGQKKMNRIFLKGALIAKPRDLERFWNDLRMICWCPVLVTAPCLALPWPSVSSMVAPPKLVRLQVDLWLVSASMRILDGECSSSALSSSLGWSSPPGGNVLAAQLLELGKNNEIVMDQVLRKELTLAMPKIYSLLMSLIGSDEMDIVKAVLEGCRWIWVGDGFATVDEVVLSGHLHLAPYIRVIPIDLAVFRELFLELGVQESLKPIDYANILDRMNKRKGCNPLDRQELSVAMFVVQYLAEVHLQDLHGQIYLPDFSCRMFPATDLVYNDAPWLLELGDSLTRKTSNIELSLKNNVHKFVHGNISNDIAEKLGVRSFRRILLAESSDSMNLSLSGVAEAFGQHEALTTRLKHIIEMYADGPGILFELVQNAEDAGACEVAFLLDKTHYGTSSILSPEMAEWQGPALYCFNNSIFSSQDLYAISRIGQDSKLEKPFSIGRFGLGFNCVYHFTDIPGFVSGENIVIFDPHTSYLPGISPSHPGLRIRFVGKNILEQFPDQFTPFLHFGCDLQTSFPGTLFRFPLRSEIAASRSQIKKEKYSPEDVQSLFSTFSEVIPEALLFLRNVKTISIYVKDGADRGMQLTYCVSRHKASEPEKELHPLHDLVSFVHGNPKGVLTKQKFFDKLGKTLDSDLPWHCQKIAILERNLSSEKLHFWMISECVGGRLAKAKSLSLANGSHSFIPWGCIAAYLYSVNAKELVDSHSIEQYFNHKAITRLQPPEYFVKDVAEFVGRAFCFLPLPISTGLPVHLNAYFELSANRRDIWFGNDMAGGGKVRSEWNSSLLEDVIAPAYARFLDVIAAEIGPCDLFFSFWPTLLGIEPWASLVRKVYMSIADLGLCALYTRARGGQWISMRQGIFPDFTFLKGNDLAEVLSEAGLPLITIPKPIMERFIDACPSLHVLNPSLLRKVLIRRKRELRNRDAMVMVLEYCLSDKEGSVCYDDLIGLPLIPLANGTFTTFKKHREGERIFIACQEEYALLRDLVPYLLVDCTIPEATFKKLQTLAESGELNVSLLTCHSLVELLPRILPPEWHDAKQVPWNPGLGGQPSAEWIQLLWSYLNSCCDDLSMFSKWPILPVGDCYLFKLVKDSNIIRNDGWSENMLSLLQKLGCFLLRSDVQIQHLQLMNFVQDPTAAGILNAVRAVAKLPQDIGGLFINASEGEIHELRSFLLQSKWFFGNQMETQHTDLIKLFPMFESYRSRKFVGLTSPTKWLKPEGIHGDLLDESFIRTESEREKTILRNYLGIREPSKTEFYRDHVLNRMGDFLQPMVLSEILVDLKHLIDSDSSMKTILSETPFVLSASGSWQYPSRLYDPHIPGLKKLLHKDYFPCDNFSNPEILETLVCLGLKRTLDFTGFLDSAKSISALHDSGDPDALNYGRRLLSCLHVLCIKLALCTEENQRESSDRTFHHNNDFPFTEHPEINGYDDCMELVEVCACFGDVKDECADQFWAEMRKIPWCPVYTSPPIEGLPWFNSKSLVASPDTTRPESQMWLVSSTMHVLDAECYSTYLQNRLGWLALPKVTVLCTQLVDISKMYHQILLDSEKKSHLDIELQKEIPALYSKLQCFIGSDDFEIAKASLNGVQWVWVGDNFVSSTALAFDAPIKYPPYLYVVPSELSEFRPLLSELGVRLTFEIPDYLHVLQCLQHDLKGEPLSPEQLNFVVCVLEATADCSTEKLLCDAYMSSLLVPDSSGSLMYAVDIVYNDAPWMEKNNASNKHFAHPNISDNLAKQLGLQSLRSLSLVDNEMTKDLPCMDYGKITELLALYGSNEFLLFDLLELADCCNAKKVHLIYDKREHPRHSLLQHNLGEFQGPSLLAIMEGVILSWDELSTLQFSPPWKLRGLTVSYGLGLLSCYVVSDLLSVLSGGSLYMFDPLGLAFSPHSTTAPSARMFSLIGTNLMEKFRDQFHPMLLNQDNLFSSSDSTIIRMPLSSRFEFESCKKKVKQIFDGFMDHSPSALLSLKSVLKVSLSTWEVGNLNPSLDYSVSIDPRSAIMRNPFSEKKWRKFHISRIFGSPSAATKSHVIDLHVFHGGNVIIDKWLSVHSLGSGQTRNMALDRRYLAYNLTPVAGVAAHISRNGQPISQHSSSYVLSPLPLSGRISMPVTVMGCFLVSHSGGRYLFNQRNDAKISEHLDITKQLMEAWNKELMFCVRDSYIEMVLELQKLRRDPLNYSVISSGSVPLSSILHAYGDRIYSLWPRSKEKSPSNKSDARNNDTCPSEMIEADWRCLIEQVIRPFYERLVDLPVWQLYCGDLVKANEGMFLSQLGSATGDSLPPDSVCSFVKEHYPVFSVPSELVSEIEAVGIKVREIKPKMVRDLLKATRSVVLRSIDTYTDVLDYCLSDIQQALSINTEGADSSEEHVYVELMGNIQPKNHASLTNSASSSTNPDDRRTHHIISQNVPSNDALEIMTSFGRALYDFGRGVVEDISRTGSPLIQKTSAIGDRAHSNGPLQSIILELKGLPFPTAAKNIARLGIAELWIGTKEQQLLMHLLADNFIHPDCLQRPNLTVLLLNDAIHNILKLQRFSPYLLSKHMRSVFSEHWVNHVLQSNQTPWISWEKKTESQDGPTPEWIELFWQTFNSMNGDLSLVSDWPLIPAFLSRPVLCRVRECDMVFVPPVSEAALVGVPLSTNSERNETFNSSGNSSTASDLMKSYISSFEMIKSRYPWLVLLLNQCNIPVYDIAFLEHGAPRTCFPAPHQSLGHVIVCKLLAAKHAGYFAEPEPFSQEDRDRLFNIFVSDFKSSSGSFYKREELDMLRALPIYKTVLASYTRLYSQDQCLIPSSAFFHPNNVLCLSSSTDGNLFYHALGVTELHDHEILMRFALPRFEEKTPEEQEDILKYLYMNWQDIQLDSNAINTLKETNFVQNANEVCSQLFKPRDLLDPCDALLASVFSEERNRFPGGRFTADGWLRILKKTGLQTSSEADMIVECARKVELLGSEVMKYIENHDDVGVEFLNSSKEISAELWSLAESIVETIFANLAVLYDNSFCGLLSKIAFVPAEKGFPTIAGKKGGKRVLSSYSEVILLKDWPLAWSCSPILVRENVVPPEFSWGAFHIRSPPPFSTVLKHLKVVGKNNGEEILARWPSSLGMMTIEDACCEILKYLDRIWGSLSASDVLELQKVEFIPVANGTRLVTANSLFVHLTVDLSPFAFELPSLYLPFVKILKDIGIHELLSVPYAKDLLLNIQKSCGYQHLNPNELRAVMEILHFICDGTSQARLDGLEWLADAIVPDDGSRLVMARSCVYVDAYGSQFLGSIDTSTLRFVHPQLPEKMCLALGVKKLSNVVMEELEEHEQLNFKDEIEYVQLKHIKDKLISRSLQEALWVVVSSLSDHIPSLEGLTWEHLQRSLQFVSEKLEFVQCIHTRFLLLPKLLDITRIDKASIIPEWEGTARHRTTHFVDRSRTRALAADPPSYMSIYDILAVVVSQVLGAAATLPIAPLLSSPPGSEKAIVKMLKVGSERKISEREDRNNTLIGKELLPQDALQVQFHPLRPFYAGEIVAWRAGKDGEKLKYGKVPEDVRPSAGQTLYRFTVETALGETQTLLSSQIFSFRSVSVANGNMPSQTSQTRMEKMGEQVPKNVVPYITSPRVATELQYGRVSAAELVQAVHDMLSTSGISIDAEKQTLMQMTLTLQEQLRESQVALLVEQEKADSAAKEADAAKAAWSCRICLAAEVEVAIIPCGHVLCLRCSSAVSRCPFCRLQVSRTIKIFRP